MKKYLITAALLFLCPVLLYASEGFEYKGSHSGYDLNIEAVVLKKIESQTDPETEKVKINGILMKLEYLNDHFQDSDGYIVAPVHYSSEKDEYIFDYYVKGDSVEKIILFSKNGDFIGTQIFPEKKEAAPEKTK